jgi:DNA polymerase III epsilon subunit-like protein
VRDHFYSLDTFERSAKKYKSGRVAGPWVDTLTKLRGELLGARNRLDDLHTGLSAQVLLRRSLTDAVAAIAAWRTALSSSDPKVISAAITRMQNRFAAAESNGRRGAFYLERGR